MSFLGKGAYGSVQKRGKYAVKKFHKTSHLIQEYAAYRYLSGVDNICQCYKVDFDTLEIYMEAHCMDMRDWLTNGHKLKELYARISDKNKMTILRDILRALVYLHSRNLVHGDLKPSNILIDINTQYKTVQGILGDLGFVSLDKYAKVDRTAELYRDIEIHHNKSHDIYSLGIIMLELFGDVKLKRQPTSYKELHEMMSTKIKNGQMAKLVISMTNSDYTKRPEAEYILKEIFKDEKIPSVEYPDYDTLIDAPGLDPSVKKKIYSWVKVTADEEKLNRGKRGYYALLKFFSKNPEITDYKLYTCSMFVILSSVFGESNTYATNDALEMCANHGKYNRTDAINAMADLLNDDDVIQILLTPSTN